MEDGMMDARTRRRYRRRLLDELGKNGKLLGRLRQSVSDRGKESATSGVFASHLAERANDEYERESDTVLADAQGRQVHEIEEALRRIEEGIFGVCEACGADIEKRRLEVIPSARFCLRCQERHERHLRN
ncbi:MAG: hypothetical protein GF346_06680 [Candidatus Eisenbacteria bacterium]|nr:hypothetical protein [Candidatus Latescibacterota bacterium]MBD3302113.1 hypothetical protein [Candidatus Eisenbacteria bacterium]